MTKTEIIYHLSDINISNNDDRYIEYETVFKKLYKLLEEEKKNKIVIICGKLYEDMKLETEYIDFIFNFLKNILNLSDLILVDANYSLEINKILDKLEKTNYKLNYIKKNEIHKINDVNYMLMSNIDENILIPFKKNKNDIHIGLHYELKHDINILGMEDMKNYDLFLLGGLNEHKFIGDRIAYAPTLIQSDYYDKVTGHGLIKWDLRKMQGELIEIPNEYCYFQGQLINKTLTIDEDVDLSNYKYICAKIEYSIDNNYDIKKIEKQLRKKFNFKELVLYEKKNNVKQVRENGLDKFYTKKNISKTCIETVDKTLDLQSFDLVIEPSAGNGSFYDQIVHKNVLGIDISPESNKLIKQDFLTFSPDLKYKNILVIGNPPFGKVSSLAVKFFNHAAEWCNVIAFIIPKTFRRISIQNNLNLNFHLIHDSDIPDSPCSFEPSMSVKCCFQIWIKKDNQRKKIILELTHKDWNFINLGPKDKNGQPTPPENADFALRAYGGKCGETFEKKLSKLRPKSYHWIKSNIDKNTLIERFNSLDYSISLDTARQNSIGKAELVKLYSDKYD